jgi:hypothetical protein
VLALVLVAALSCRGLALKASDLGWLINPSIFFWYSAARWPSQALMGLERVLLAARANL